MLIDENGILKELTAEEEKEWMESHPGSNEEPTEINNQDALTDFLTGLSSPEITSIAKIRQLAKEFLERSVD